MAAWSISAAWGQRCASRPANRADMVTCEWGRHHDWSPFDFVVRLRPAPAAPGPCRAGPACRTVPRPAYARPQFADRGRHHAGQQDLVCHDPRADLSGASGKVMQAIGTTEAMNLDAGTSTGFYYNGATLARPGRQLTNMIVVYGQKQRYERALDQLVPASYRRSSLHAIAHRQLSALVHP